MLFYYCVAIIIQTFSLLSVQHLLRRWYCTLYFHMQHSTLAFCTCNFISRNFLLDPGQR